MAKTNEETFFRSFFIFSKSPDFFGDNGKADFESFLSEVKLHVNDFGSIAKLKSNDKELLFRFYENPKIIAQSEDSIWVSFELKAVFKPEEEARISQLLADLAQSKSEKEWVLPSGTVKCLWASGGTNEALQKELLKFMRPFASHNDLLEVVNKK